jgi:HAD superfamily hydrolase (TIGR01490 family)
VALAIFDLDNTLIAGDSDHAWSEFLISEGLVDAAVVKKANDAFYQQYLNGGLDIQAYLEFALSFLAGKTHEEVAPLHERFMANVIEPMLLPKAFELIERHKSNGDTLLVITATNRFVTAPIVARLGISHLIACEPELIDGRYTGLPSGVPSFAHGKVTRLKAWLAEQKMTLDGSWFYSDSHNDLPLLEHVDHPVAVNPDDKLLSVAQTNGWTVLDLRIPE